MKKALYKKEISTKADISRQRVRDKHFACIKPKTLKWCKRCMSKAHRQAVNV